MSCSEFSLQATSKLQVKLDIGIYTLDFINWS